MNDYLLPTGDHLPTDTGKTQISSLNQSTMKTFSILFFSLLLSINCYNQMDSISAKEYKQHLNYGRALHGVGYTVLAASTIAVIVGINQANHATGFDLGGAGTAILGLEGGLVSIPFFVAGTHQKRTARRILAEQGGMSLAFIKDGMGRYQTNIQFKITF